MRIQKQKADLNRIFIDVRLQFEKQQETFQPIVTFDTAYYSDLLNQLERHLKRMVLEGKLLKMFVNTELVYRKAEGSFRDFFSSNGRNMSQSCIKCLKELLFSKIEAPFSRRRTAIFPLDKVMDYVRFSHVIHYPAHLVGKEECLDWFKAKVKEVLEREEQWSHEDLWFSLNLDSRPHWVEISNCKKLPPHALKTEKPKAKRICKEAAAVIEESS